ncbi:MAG TPA: IS1595 family transposase [Rhizomicrobium sp.]|nr:IS1595 family transposase [Rhizomicrobium sp.]
MAKSVLNAAHFQDEAAAFAYVEAALWPNGPVCPFCGEKERIGELKGATTRPGLRKCYACRKPFTVRIGSIFESSHLALHLWLQVIHLMCASKKGISTRQIQRMLQCSMKTAWFVGHRVRHVMSPTASEPPLGGRGKVVEADETYIGTAEGKRGKRPWGGMGHKMKIMSLVERDGKVRSQKIKDATKLTAQDVLKANVHPESILHTDGSQIYRGTGMTKKHEFVDHQLGYVGMGQNGRKVHTNTLEGFFSVFKRGMVGVYQHASEAHLDKYLHEFDFRANHREKFGINDVSRAEIALKAATGKRLTYETTRSAKNA